MSILSMSVSKQDAERVLHGLLPQIVCHAIKLCIVKSTADERDRWCNEIDTWLETIRSHITNIKTSSGVLGYGSIIKQIDTCKELQPHRINRTLQYIEVRWARKESRKIEYNYSNPIKALQDIRAWLISALRSMSDDTWEFDVLLDPDFTTLLNNYGALK